MIIKSLSSSILFALGFYCASAQDFSSELQFLKHLEGIKQYKEAGFYLNEMYPKYVAPGERDTLNFLKGKYAYQLKDIPKSVSAFNQISQSSLQTWEIAQFFIAFQLAYTHQLDSSIHVLSKAKFNDPVRQELKKYELASDYLLKRDFNSFDQLSSTFNFEYYQLADYQGDMIDLASEIKKHKTKSPFVAGLLSAIVPGAGRYYQGQIGQGTMALVSTGIFALQAREAYQKDGLKSARFVIFGSLFSVFYMANVWGSAVSVRVNEVRFNENVDEAIYINMHLPIRLLFD